MIRVFRRPRAVFIGSIVYWLLLIGIGLGPGLLAAWRATQTSGHDSSVNVQYGTGGLELHVVNRGMPTFSGSIGLLTAALWLGAPPLVFWLLWLIAPGRREPAAPTASRIP